MLDLWPLSVAERADVRPEIIAQLLTEPQAVLGIEAAPVKRHEYLQLARTGGFFRKLHSGPQVAPAAGGSRIICAR